MLDPHEIVVAVRLNGLASFLHLRSDLLPDNDKVNVAHVHDSLFELYPLPDHYSWAVTWSVAFHAYLISLYTNRNTHNIIATCCFDRMARTRVILR